MASPFSLIHLESGVIDLLARTLGYKYDIVHSTIIPLEILFSVSFIFGRSLLVA